MILILVEVLSVKRTCLYRELLYTYNNFHLNLGFMFLNLDSRKGSLHSLKPDFTKKVLYTDNSSTCLIPGTLNGGSPFPQ